MKKIVILGAGGHSRMIATLIQDMAECGEAVEIVGYTSEHEPKRAPLGGPIFGNDDILGDLAASGRATHFVIGRGSVLGGTPDRPRLFELAKSAGLEPVTVYHRTSTVLPSATVGAGTVLMPNSVVCSDVVLGENVIVNTNSSVDHDGRIGDHTHLSAGVTLAGTVTVGKNCFIGTGSTISHSRVVGDNVTVGAGALVLYDVEDELVVAGVPAKPLPRKH